MRATMTRTVINLDPQRGSRVHRLPGLRRGDDGPRHRSEMRSTLLAAMRSRGGVMTRADALQVVPRHILDSALRVGSVVRIHPRVYAVGELRDDTAALDHAALAFAPGAALSHTTALRVFGIPLQP